MIVISSIVDNYNIPRKIRELQLNNTRDEMQYIITYQEKLGNYNLFWKLF